VLLGLLLVPVAVAATIAAFAVFAPAEILVAERRPPPAEGLTNAVGEYAVGDSQPQPYADACPRLAGVQIAGTAQDQRALRLGLAALCNTSLPDAIGDDLARFAEAGGVVRFAVFELTGVDSTAEIDAAPPRILLNAKLQRTDPLWIAPLVAHDATVLGGDPATAETALEARRVEALVCERVLGGRRPSRGCDDARAVLDLLDPLTALRDAGFR
jgi:hypothetical protein